MKQFIEEFRDAQEVLDILERGGMTDYTRYPQIYFLWNLAKTSNDFGPLTRMLQEDRWIIPAAVKFADEHPYRPLPYGEELARIRGPLLFGWVNHNLDWCGFHPEDFKRGLIICGATGSGKTHPVLRLLWQILQEPPSKRGYNVIIIQVVKRDADFLILDYPHLRIIEWKDLRHAMFATEDWDSEATNIETATSTFAIANYLMSLTQPVLKGAVRLCQAKGAPLTFSNINKEVETAADTLATSFRANDSVFRIKARMFEFIDTGPVMDTPAGFSIADFWTKEDVCVNLMDQPNDYIYATFITDLLMKLQRYHNKHKTSDKLNTLIVIDECRSVFPARRDIHDIDPDRLMERFITTARSAGIGRITITQEPQSVTDWLADNSAFFVTFPIAGQAYEYLRRCQNLKDDQLDYIEKLPEKGTGIMRDVRFDRKYLVQIPGDL